jgi:hypothetical protein
LSFVPIDFLEPDPSSLEEIRWIGDTIAEDRVSGELYGVIDERGRLESLTYLRASKIRRTEPAPTKSRIRRTSWRRRLRPPIFAGRGSPDGAGSYKEDFL